MFANVIISILYFLNLPTSTFTSNVRETGTASTLPNAAVTDKLKAAPVRHCGATFRPCTWEADPGQPGQGSRTGRVTLFQKPANKQQQNPALSLLIKV